MVTTGYVLRFTLPPARNHTHALWGLSRYDWGAFIPGPALDCYSS
jgi:hypothetical protein